MINKSDRDAFANYLQSMQERIRVRAEQAIKICLSPEHHNNFLVFKKFLHALPASNNCGLFCYLLIKVS